MTKPLTILGIETSCDETAAAIVRGLPPGPGEILSNIVASQIAEHRPYGGVVPEIAARAHVEILDGIVERALAESNTALSDLDAIAVTAGPGLIGGVAVGLSLAKGLALASSKPIIALNHLEGHALTVRLTHGIEFPYLLLLVSGGHCQLLVAEGVGQFKRIGTTIDDAAGEAFDKTAKLLGLGFPGGPAVERAAAQGNPKRHRFPRPLAAADGFDFSFSGLKTAVRRAVETAGDLTPNAINDLAAGFQAAAIDVLVSRTAKAMEHFARTHQGPHRVVVAGGVAANKSLNVSLADAAKHSGFDLFIPAPSLCTDNAAMIAWGGLEYVALGKRDQLDIAPHARWPLDASRRNIAGAKA
jgi:N6-L-threonylcarbamoyladenine synthase